jgi:3'(2'), 5'-bisphosphate nucleotidase
MTEPELQELLAISRLAGWTAADILLKAQAGNLEIQDSGDGPVTVADLAANECILQILQQQLGTQDFAYLTEETYKTQPDDFSAAPYTWVIDPLDGTKDFIQQTGEYAVHIALVHQQRPILSVVVCPAVGKLYSAIVHQGTQVEGRDGSITPVRVSERNSFNRLIVVTSRSHRSDRFNQLMQRFPVQQQKSVGSLGGKIAAIVEQQADVYVSLSGKSAPKDWDLAAPELILTEAGGKFTHFDGTPLRYTQADVTQWGGLLASNGTAHALLCTAARQIMADLDQTQDHKPATQNP